MLHVEINVIFLLYNTLIDEHLTLSCVHFLFLFPAKFEHEVWWCADSIYLTSAGEQQNGNDKHCRLTLYDSNGDIVIITFRVCT